MRIALAVSLAALAASPLLAQKPEAGDDPRERYRDQGISMCVAEMNAIEGVTPDAGEALCGCALDRFMPRWPTGALPPLGAGPLAPAMEVDLLACANTQDAVLAVAIARHMAQSPSSAAAPVFVPAPTPVVSDKRPDGPEASDFDFGAWLDAVPLGRWLARSDLPLWAWAALAALLLVLLRALFGRREGQDLLGPPRSMRPGPRPGSWPR